MRFSVVLLVALAAVASSSSQSKPQTLPKQRLTRFIEAINSHQLSNVEAFVKTDFNPLAFKGRTVSQQAARLFTLADLGPPFSIGKTVQESANSIVVEIRSSRGENWEMKMTLSPSKAHKVDSIRMGGPGSQTASPPKNYTGWKSLKELLTSIKSDTGVPALGIAYSAGPATHVEVVGVREIHKTDPVQPTDRWLIGSITKSMTATMIARLVDKGVLRWDTHLRDAFPKMPMRKEYESVTLLQLLQHRAGVQQDKYVDPAFLDQASGNATALVAVRDHYTQFTLEREPVGKPGKDMAYSNAGYTIAAHIAEVKAGKPYERLMKELVFEPLGMKTAKMGVPGTPGNPGGMGQLNGHLIGAKGLTPHVINEPKLNAIQEPAGAGVSMSLDDLLKFARYHLAGLKGKATLMSQKNFNILHDPADHREGAYKYACGWVVDTTSTKTSLHGHNGSDGTFWAEMAIWPDKNLAAVAISNAANQKTPSPPMQAILAVYNRGN